MSQCSPLQAGISFAGEPSGYAELPSVEGCCALCERTSSCLFFTHWSSLADAPSRCELYSSHIGSQLAPEHSTVTSGALPWAHWLAPSSAACRFSAPEPGTLASAPLVAAPAFATLEAAQEACVALDQSCTGVTSGGGARGRYRVRGGGAVQPSPSGEQASFKVGCDGARCDLEEGAWFAGELLYTRYEARQHAGGARHLAAPQLTGLLGLTPGAEPLRAHRQAAVRRPGPTSGAHAAASHVQVPSATACCDACLATPRCAGFNYNRRSTGARPGRAGSQPGRVGS